MLGRVVLNQHNDIFKVTQTTRLLKYLISFLLTLLAAAKSSQGCWDRSRSSRKLSFLSFYIGRRRVQRRRPYTVLHGALGLSLICLEGLSQSCSLRSRACGALPGLLYYTGSATLIYPAIATKWGSSCIDSTCRYWYAGCTTICLL